MVHLPICMTYNYRHLGELGQKHPGLVSVLHIFGYRPTISNRSKVIQMRCIGDVNTEVKDKAKSKCSFKALEDLMNEGNRNSSVNKFR